MKLAVVYIPYVALIIAAFSTLVDFRAELFRRQAMSLDKSLREKITVQVERDGLIELAQRAGSSAGARAETHAFYASLLRDRGNEILDIKERVALYCQALAEFGQALRKKPRESQYLLNWADLRQLLGRIECPGEYSSGDFRKALELALIEDPTNGAVLFAGGLLFSWAGDTASAGELFHRVLLYAATLSAEQTRYIAQQIKSGADLRKIVPARFPQVVEWSQSFQQQNPEQFLSWKDDFAWLQFQALEEAVTEYENGQIEGEIHFNRMMSLVSCVASTEVRQKLDVELALFFRRSQHTAAADYFDRRGPLRDVEIVRASIEGDTRPLKSSLAAWAHQDWVKLDSFYTTVGFYLPEGKMARLIELYSPSGNPSSLMREIKILAGNDNRRWVALQEEVQVDSIQIGGRFFVSIEPSSERFKYWKIHFSGSTRDGGFGNSLNALVKVYG